jgi:hypothetical protein
VQARSNTANIESAIVVPERIDGLVIGGLEVRIVTEVPQLGVVGRGAVVLRTVETVGKDRILVGATHGEV